MIPAPQVLAWADSLPHIVWIANGGGSHTHFSRQWYALTGLTEQESRGFGWTRALHPDDVARAMRRWERACRTGEPYECEYRIRSRARGAYRWFLARAVPARDAAGRVVQWTGTSTDIEDQKRTARELERDLLHQAHTDVVTGVPNRRRAEDLLERSLNAPGGGAVLFLDLDDFKHVNEAHGHIAGDALLRSVAARIADMLGDGDVVARWGGDEFLVILSGVDEGERALSRAMEIEASLRAPFLVHGHTVVTSASVGVALFEDGTPDVARPVLEADIALNRAKRHGKRHAVLFREPMGAESARRLRIERALRVALETGDDALRLQYQARVDPVTGRAVAYEALSRWTHPTLGTLSPSEFVPIAEASGLIDVLTRRVLDAATRQARAWLDAGSPRIVSVNLSAACIRRGDILHDVRRVLDRHGLPASLLELEVTETAAMSGMEESIANLEALRASGVSLSVDDFGTAYSSLTYLRVLPVDTIKIDRSFVSHIADDVDDTPTESGIVKGIVALGRSLGMRVVAEGVETRSQADFLRRLGCDGVQGFYYGRSQTAEAIAAEGGLGPRA